MLVKQTHWKAEEKLEIKISQPRETFHFNPPLPIEGSWMFRLTSLEVYKSIFIVTEEIIKFELYADIFDEFSFSERRNEPEKIRSISDITPYHLQHDKIGPHILEAHKKLRSEKSSTDGFIILLLGYGRSPFRDFESCFRIVVGLDGEIFN